MISLEYMPQGVAIGKRAFDVSIALVGLIALAPIMMIVAVVIKLDSPGPVLFRQQRIGRCWRDRSELIWMYKFRSMSTDAERVTGAVWATKNDPRVTRVGRFLRMSRLDELPQLLNVLRGDMSLIGPRPERPGFYQKLEEAIPYFAERTYGIRPGITGLAQVYQGYDRNIEDVRRKVLFDHAYALSLSRPASWLSMDAMIMVRTVWVMVAGRGQ